MQMVNIPALMQEQERPLRLKAVHIISKYAVHLMIERQMVSTPLNGEQNRITESQKGPQSVKALGAVLLDTVVFLYTKIFYILLLTNLFKNTILISITVIVIIFKISFQKGRIT